jgi:ribose 5-phosphate isomerase B
VPGPGGSIALGSDHAGLAIKREVASKLSMLGRKFIDLGTNSDASVDYPDFAAAVSEGVAAGQHELGILVCGTGIGMSIAANKVPGIRAALCDNELEAQLARAHNDANVLCLGGRIVGPALAGAIVERFLTTSFEGGRHQGRLDKIAALQRQSGQARKDSP